MESPYESCRPGHGSHSVAGIAGQNSRSISSGTENSECLCAGDTSRLADFVESCRREFADHGLKLQLVSSDSEFQYNVVIAQESSVSGAAAAVVALDRKGVFVASVVRSGRMSGKGALNASAKELAKKLAILASQ
jgi:hypothetical protein